MTDFVFPPAETPWLAVRDSKARFPVRRVWCVGRNYLAHVRELGNDEREPPFFFSKQPDMLMPGGGAIRYPALTKNYHFEVELVVALKEGGADLCPADAPSLIFGYAVGIDLTRRDLQNAAKAKGQPWEIGKSFEQSAPVAPLSPSSAILSAARIRLAVNDDTRQDSNIDQMMWSVPEIIAQLSRQVTLAAGDIIFTGTPEGVGAVGRGDVLDAGIEGLEPLRVTII